LKNPSGTAKSPDAVSKLLKAKSTMDAMIGTQTGIWLDRASLGKRASDVRRTTNARPKE
jgi:hypothetical protein